MIARITDRYRAKNNQLILYYIIIYITSENILVYVRKYLLVICYMIKKLPEDMEIEGYYSNQS
jgi:hypothetical protein